MVNKIPSHVEVPPIVSSTVEVTINKSFDEHLRDISFDKEVTDLYKTIKTEVFQEQEGSKEQMVKEMEGKISNCNEKLSALDNKYLSGNIQDDDYKRMSLHLKEEIDRLKRDKEGLLMFDSDLEKYFSYAI